jgi:hypothetical protein
MQAMPRKKPKSRNSKKTSAAERQAPDADILRAHPVEGEIDYAELRREHIARYPKIRAALAE